MNFVTACIDIFMLIYKGTIHTCIHMYTLIHRSRFGSSSDAKLLNSIDYFSVRRILSKRTLRLCIRSCAASFFLFLNGGRGGGLGDVCGSEPFG